ncbi:MAG: 2,3-diphosphoglycerate-dependent phosphoglycerate mutase [Gallionella sp.]|nr:2,3-diphosphoglycerate-dependent phosphoglycerate mutase [Gallionella sp.]MDD4947318.1 2,3-diphosphoglycerate-dependent phosphoglycerate mutase [Gallionella sp.]MDD5612270.1 2,3-diphosphoglycerate-dependent phosphoglycerate mutase [Gallionella sp.]
MTSDTGLLVLLRHGYSLWNQQRRFTGWTDVELCEHGWAQTLDAGRLIGNRGIKLDEVHTSVLQRTYLMVDQLLQSAGHPDIPRHTSWRLNERHYGQLQGIAKEDIFATWGEQIAHGWWRGYYQKPPPLDWNDLRHPRFDPLYADLDPAMLPDSESLFNCQQRLLPYWQDILLPRLADQRNLLVISHGNTLRGLIMHLEKIPAEEVGKLEVPSGLPLLYRFDNTMQVSERTWLK